MMKFTSYLPMVGGSLRILRLIPLLKLVESAVKTPKIKSNQINKCINTKMHHFCNTLSWFLLFQNSCELCFFWKLCTCIFHFTNRDWFLLFCFIIFLNEYICISDTQLTRFKNQNMGNGSYHYVYHIQYYKLHYAKIYFDSK